MVEAGILRCPVVLACAVGNAQHDVVGTDVGRYVLDQDLAAVVTDGDAGLQPENCWVPRRNCREVAGDGAAGQEVGRADDIDQVFAGDPGPPDAATVLLLGSGGAAGGAAGLGGAGGGLVLRRAEIDQATGMLTEQLGVGISEAFVRLRAYAYAHDRRLGDLAGDIVARRLRLGPDGLGPGGLGPGGGRG